MRRGIIYIILSVIIFLTGCVNQETIESESSALQLNESQPVQEVNRTELANESTSEQAPHIEDLKEIKSDICDDKPVFTSDITDLSKIELIIPPINKIENDYKTHAFIKIRSGEVPVYSPIDSVFNSGTYYLEDNRGQYILTFDVKNSCDEIQFRFDHLSKVVDRLRVYLPSIPQEDSRTSPTEAVVEFKAGELIGYTVGTDLGKTWDFGVYNYQELNQFNNKEDPYYDSPIKKNGVCPFKYFVDKEKYQLLFRNSDDSGYSNELDLCKGLE